MNFIQKVFLTRVPEISVNIHHFTRCISSNFTVYMVDRFPCIVNYSTIAAEIAEPEQGIFFNVGREDYAGDTHKAEIFMPKANN